MLLGLNPLLSPDLLHALRAMGHGDEITIVDANFPAHSTVDRVIRLDGVDAAEALKAVLSVMPLDIYVDHAAFSMEDKNDPANFPSTVQNFQVIIDEMSSSSHSIQQLERFAFYDQAQRSYAIIQTGETRHFGNLILKKGVLPST